MVNVITVASRAAMAALASPSAGDTVFLTEAGRVGFFECLAGSAPVTDTLQGLYVASSTTGFYYARVREGDIGRPEWFGALPGSAASDCLSALQACTSLCQRTILDAKDYYITDLFQFAYSGKVLEGQAGSGTNFGLGYHPDGIGTAGGTRVILTGANVVSGTVFQFGSSSGSSDDGSITRNAFVRNIKFARDCSVYTPRASLSGDPIDCVKGVIMSFISTSGMYNVKSYDSAVGFHCFGVVNSTLDECNVRRTTAASTSTNDFFVGFLIGGYAPNYGYIGANASIYLRHCTVFDSNPAFSTSVGLKLFGYIADTFVDQFEMARLNYGIVIDGSDSSGVTIPTGSGNGGSHQDVTIDKAVIDGVDIGGIVVRNLNDTNSTMISNPYIAVANGSQSGRAALSITNAAGRLNVTQGRILGYNAPGVQVTNVNGFSIRGIVIRDCSAPLVFNNCGMFDAEPIIFALGVSATNACSLTGCFRGYIRPHIDGAPGMVTYGVSLDSACNFLEVDGSVINPGAMVTISSAYKVLFAGNDASTGSGAAAFAAASNVLSGVKG